MFAYEEPNSRFVDGDCPWCGSRLCDQSEIRCPGLQDDAARDCQYRLKERARWCHLQAGSFALTLPGEGETTEEKRRRAVTLGWMEPNWNGREFAFEWTPASGKGTPNWITKTFREFIFAAPIKGL